MQDGRAGVGDRPWLGVHDRDVHVVVGEHRGQHQPGRPGAADEHLGAHGGATVPYRL
ncbi:MAG TPA: hypothetical protein VM347_01060 [Nonomuraea sp.]|nr:hypothetical protein [Nonomuraea sp.]